MSQKQTFSCTQSCVILSDDHFFSHIMKRQFQAHGITPLVFKSYGELCGDLPKDQAIRVVVLDSAVGTDDPRSLHTVCSNHKELKDAYMVILYERDINPSDLPKNDKTIHLNKHSIVAKDVIDAVVKSCV